MPAPPRPAATNGTSRRFTAAMAESAVNAEVPEQLGPPARWPRTRSMPMNTPSGPSQRSQPKPHAASMPHRGSNGAQHRGRGQLSSAAGEQVPGRAWRHHGRPGSPPPPGSSPRRPAPPRPPTARRDQRRLRAARPPPPARSRPGRSGSPPTSVRKRRQAAVRDSTSMRRPVRCGGSPAPSIPPFPPRPPGRMHLQVPGIARSDGKLLHRLVASAPSSPSPMLSCVSDVDHTLPHHAPPSAAPGACSRVNTKVGADRKRQHARRAAPCRSPQAAIPCSRDAPMDIPPAIRCPA